MTLMSIYSAEEDASILCDLLTLWLLVFLLNFRNFQGQLEGASGPFGMNRLKVSLSKLNTLVKVTNPNLYGFRRVAIITLKLFLGGGWRAIFLNVLRSLTTSMKKFLHITLHKRNIKKKSIINAFSNMEGNFKLSWSLTLMPFWSAKVDASVQSNPMSLWWIVQKLLVVFFYWNLETFRRNDC